MSKPHTILFYSDSGGTKTSQLYHMARYINKKYNVVGRIIGANASDSAPFEQSGMIERGVVDCFDVSSREFALGDMRKLSEGYWPVDAKDAKGNIISKGYFKKDENCALKDWPTVAGNVKDIGFYGIEGITGVSSLLLNHIRNQDEGVGFKHSYKYEEEGYLFGGLQPGHYGLVQQEMYKLIVQGFATLPVKYVIWTALVGKGEDRTKQTIYGPKSAGDATTYEIPSWFHDCFHLDKIIEEDKEGNKVEQRVAWFVEHYDTETGIKYLAKCRILPELFPELLRYFPKGYVKLDFKNGIDVFYRVVDKIVKEWKEGQGIG